MASTVFEIIELTEGEFVLQRSGEADEPLVSIKFSSEALEFLAGNSVEVAKTMIEAGIHEVEDIMDDKVASEDENENRSQSSPVIH